MPNAHLIRLALCGSIALTAIGSGLRAQGADASALDARLRRVVAALAHDSMAGRATPSPQLETAAAFVASEFKRAGLQPRGDSGSWFQRYQVVETRVDVDSTRIEIGALADWRFAKDWYFGGGQGTKVFGSLRGDAVLVTGNITPESAPALRVKGKVVVYLPTPRVPRGENYRSAFALSGSGVVGVIYAGGLHDSTWTQLSADPEEYQPSTAPAWPIWTAQKPAGHVAFIPILELWRQRVGPLLLASGIDTSAVRSPDGSPKVTPLGVEARLHFPRRTLHEGQGTNVVGVIRGSHATLRNEYVVVSAHLDGLGRREGPDGVLNGADDNASGVAALAELARTLTAARPTRSILLVAVSGEEKGLWGSDWFASHLPVPQSAVIANVNLDMVGRSVADSVYVLGRSNQAIGPIANRALTRTKAHGLVVLDEAVLARRYPDQPIGERSDHANFVRRGIPAIYFFTGWHADYHESTDDADTLNYPALGRIVRSAHDVTVEIANKPR